MSYLMTHLMKIMWKITDKKPEGYDDFLRLSRSLMSDFLNGKITLQEFIVIIWLSLNANPYNGKFHTSCSALVSDLKRIFAGYKDKENKANKIFLALLQKKYIWFPKHQGSRSSFEGVVDKYPLSSGQYIDVSGWSEEYNSRSEKELSVEVKQNDGRSVVDVITNQQKLKEIRNDLKKRFSMSSENDFGRSANNDNDNKNNNTIDNKKFLKESNCSFTYKEIIPADSFSPKNYEQQRCWEIAQKLGESDMRFILSCLKKYGINHIERAWGIFQEIPQRKIQDRRKYFNKLIRNLAKNQEKTPNYTYKNLYVNNNTLTL
jgi:hypothetical protein